MGSKVTTGKRGRRIKVGPNSWHNVKADGTTSSWTTKSGHLTHTTKAGGATRTTAKEGDGNYTVYSNNSNSRKSRRKSQKVSASPIGAIAFLILAFAVVAGWLAEKV